MKHKLLASFLKAKYDMTDEEIEMFIKREKYCLRDWYGVAVLKLQQEMTADCE